jgi:dienelactone hydrolase
MSSFLSGEKSIRIEQHEPTAPGPHPAILLLHGSNGNASFWSERIAPYIAGRNIALYVIHYFDRTGTTSATYDDIMDGYHFPEWLSAIRDGLAYIRARPSVDPNRIALIGFSLGAFLALSVATDPAANIRAIVEISGGLPEPYATNATSAFPPTLIFHGGEDTYVTVSDAQKLDAKLTALKVPHETHIYPKQGHFFNSITQLQMLMATTGFLRKHLEPPQNPHSAVSSCTELSS